LEKDFWIPAYAGITGGQWKNSPTAQLAIEENLNVTYVIHAQENVSKLGKSPIF